MDFINLITRYMAENYVRFEDGQIWFGKERDHFDFLPILAKEYLINAEIEGPMYEATMFLLAKKVGYNFVAQHAIPLVKSWTPVVRMGLDWMDVTGVGAYRLAKANNEQGFLVAVGKSAFGSEVKLQTPNRNKPVDLASVGLVAGSIEYYVKRPMYAVEPVCVAQKNVQECVLVVGDRKDITGYVKDFSPDRLDYANGVLDQIEKAEKLIKEKKIEKWIV